MKCPACGTRLSKEATFCHKCYAPLAATAAPSTASPPPSPPSIVVPSLVPVVASWGPRAAHRSRTARLVVAGSIAFALILVALLLTRPWENHGTPDGTGNILVAVKHDMATRNYRITIVQNSYDTFTKVYATLRIAATIVHRGATFLYVQTSSSVGGGEVDFVNTGQHMCVQQGLDRQFKCEPLHSTNDVVGLVGYMVLGPDAMLTHLHEASRATLSGESIVAGQSAHRFKIRARQVIQGGMDGPFTDTKTGTLYTALGTNLPISEATQEIVDSNRVVTLQTMVRWSHWDDQHLTIPSVPAS